MKKANLKNKFSNKARRFHSPYNKIVSNKVAVSRVRSWKSRGFRVVIVDAVLDIPHYRHADYFLACANLGDKLLVRIPSNKLISLKKDPHGPIISWSERAKHAAHYPYIDLITSKSDFGGNWLNVYLPDIIVRSITNGKELIEEYNNLAPKYDQLGIELVIMDQYAQQVPSKDLVKQSKLYSANKFSKDKFSGTIIKKKIESRLIKSYLKSKSKLNK